MVSSFVERNRLIPEVIINLYDGSIEECIERVMDEYLKMVYEPVDLCALRSEIRDDLECLDAGRRAEYLHYDVDDDFDLAVAMYNERRHEMDGLMDPGLAEFRVSVGLNPAYTDRCFSSYAFDDVRDEILRRL